MLNKKGYQAGLEITCTQSRVYLTSSPAIFEIHRFSDNLV